ncbi:hypothetical protein [Crateriforma spongiae]|uniref:hypothetical protein n=1 Tax=Crateriforma spongiae TaxID=2724528 RepID=UPI0039AF61B5
MTFFEVESRSRGPAEPYRSVDETKDLRQMKASIFDLLLATISASLAFALWKSFPEFADIAVTIGLCTLLTTTSFVRRKRIWTCFFAATAIAFLARFGLHLDMVTSPFFLAEFFDLSLAFFCFGVVIHSALLNRRLTGLCWLIAASFVPLCVASVVYPILPLIPLSIMTTISFALVLTWRRDSTAREATEPSRAPEPGLRDFSNGQSTFPAR